MASGSYECQGKSTQPLFQQQYLISPLLYGFSLTSQDDLPQVHATSDTAGSCLPGFAALRRSTRPSSRCASWFPAMTTISLWCGLPWWSVVWISHYWKIKTIPVLPVLGITCLSGQIIQSMSRTRILIKSLKDPILDCENRRSYTSKIEGMVLRKRKIL